jgi:NAD(P)-dependent dehydrogenase (short-subunit alcohol dehydrogenase family)
MTVSPDLSGCVAIVTGAARGIGRGAALGLGEAGAAVLAGDVLSESVEETAQEIVASGRACIAVEADVSNPEGADTMVDVALAQMPLGRFGKVEEVVPTIVLLASDLGSFYTGATLNVSGGDVMI